MWGLTIGFAAYGYLFAFLLTWLPTYLQSTFGVNILKAGGYVFLIWGVGTLTDLLVGGWLVDYLIKRGADANRVRKTVLIVGLIMGFAVIGAAYTKDINVAVAWITIAVAGHLVPRPGRLVDPGPDRAGRQHRAGRRHHELPQQRRRLLRPDDHRHHRRAHRLVQQRADRGRRDPESSASSRTSSSWAASRRSPNRAACLTSRG